MINIENVIYKTFGNCLKISNGSVELLVTTDFGPRIIYYGINGINIMYEDSLDKINKDGEFFEKNFSKEDGIWHIYGGHRLWKSPEYMDTYYPDNAPVKVELIENGAVFTSNVEKTTKLEKCMKIVMDLDGSVSVDHIMTNKGNNKTSKIALWALSVLDKGAVATIPLSTKDTGLLPNRNLVLWSYTDIKDERLELTQDCIKVTQMDKEPMKIGTCIDGTIIVNTKGMRFTLQNKYVEGEFADYSCNTECYTSPLMLEIETLSPLQELLPGERAVHTERWTLQ